VPSAVGSLSLFRQGREGDSCGSEVDGASGRFSAFVESSLLYDIPATLMCRRRITFPADGLCWISNLEKGRNRDVA
jgi:hypothetical protein